VTTPGLSSPDKLPATAIFALLDGAPFGRLATYSPATAGAPARCYVVPLQFLHREGEIFLITTPGRKLRNLRAAPHGVCFQLDLTEGAGWTSVCAWGDYSDVLGLRARVSVVAASFGKYPDRTTKQAATWLRRHTPNPLHHEAADRSLAVGRINLTSVSGRSWPGLEISAAPHLVRPPHAVFPLGALRSRPQALDRPGCDALLAARPLARVACFDRERNRTYCVPLWYQVEGRDLWFYHPSPGQGILHLLRAQPEGVCAQVDDLDCSPQADPGQPWRSVVGEGHASVFPLGAGGALPPDRQRAVLRALRDRLLGFGISSVFVPPDPDLGPPEGALVRLRLQAMSGQATGAPL
jgi:nitroimidazol reductase NimA-like FMN-containing flavoprotein (pyridoxamine 5'-phosphate oxidase superfamily)